MQQTPQVVSYFPTVGDSLVESYSWSRHIIKYYLIVCFIDAKKTPHSSSITKNMFFNIRGVFGGVIYLVSSFHQIFTILSDCVFQYNTADSGGIMETAESSILHCTFNLNIGSIYAINSDITFDGQNSFENYIEPHSTLGLSVHRG